MAPVLQNDAHDRDDTMKWMPSPPYDPGLPNHAGDIGAPQFGHL